MLFKAKHGEQTKKAIRYTADSAHIASSLVGFIAPIVSSVLVECMLSLHSLPHVAMLQQLLLGYGETVLPQLTTNLLSVAREHPEGCPIAAEEHVAVIDIVRCSTMGSADAGCGLIIDIIKHFLLLSLHEVELAQLLGDTILSVMYAQSDVLHHLTQFCEVKWHLYNVITIT